MARKLITGTHVATTYFREICFGQNLFTRTILHLFFAYYFSLFKGNIINKGINNRKGWHLAFAEPCKLPNRNH